VDKEICDEGITLDEISKAVKLQKPDKSPEEDGWSVLIIFGNTRFSLSANIFDTIL
jgi:hypothetical protein